LTDVEDSPLYEKMRQQFRLRQLEKNAESIRQHHPEFRRHQRQVKEEIDKVADVFLNTAQDTYIANHIETMFHYKGLGHPTNPYQFIEDPGKVLYEVHRKPETPEERAARLQRLAEIEAAKNPKLPDEEEDYARD
jgi:hypothetical protein